MSKTSDRRVECSTDLAFSFPVLLIGEIAAAAGVDVSSGFDEHVACGHHVGDGRPSGVVKGEPEGYGDIVVGITVYDWDEAVYAEEELGSAVIVC